MKHFFCLQASNLGPEMGRRHPEWQVARSYLVECRQVLDTIDTR